MDYKIWFNQALPKAVHRTLEMGFHRSTRDLDKTGVLSDCASRNTVQRLWNVNSPTGLFADPALHQELDRLMARMRIS